MSEKAPITIQTGIYLAVSKGVCLARTVTNSNPYLDTISQMRKSLRFAEPSQRQQLQTQFARTLKAVMEQIKQDLKLMVQSPPEHAKYIDFVRSVVALIRAQDICPVDPYFYQMSPEYSPSRQDPRLQTAGILACGLRLEEAAVAAAGANGNAQAAAAASSLFYLLWPNLTTALAAGRLADERAILARGMRHPHVLAFMLGRMLPAVVATAARRADGWALMETYVGALERWVVGNDPGGDDDPGPAVHREICDDTMGRSVPALLRSAEAGVRHLRGLAAAGDLCPEHLHTLAQLLRLLNLLAPSVRAYLANCDNGNYSGDGSGSNGNNWTSQSAEDISRIANSLADFTRVVASYTASLLDGPSWSPGRAASVIDAQPFTVNPARLFEGVRSSDPRPDPDPVPTLHHNNNNSSEQQQIDSFSAHMLREMGSSWVVTSVASGPATFTNVLTVRGPARGGGTGPPLATQTSSSSGGIPIPSWDARELVGRLWEQARAWNQAFGDGKTATTTTMIPTREEFGVVDRRGRGPGGVSWESRWLGKGMEGICLF